jgi:HJR/Mrr/RecB family endonuclease
MRSKRAHAKRGVNLSPVLAVGTALGILWLVGSAVQQTDSLLPVTLITAGLAFGAYTYLTAPQKSLQQKLSTVLTQHIDALTTRRAQLVHRDAYGNQQMKHWNAEIDHFLNSVLLPTLSSREAGALSRRKADLAFYIEQEVVRYALSNPPMQEFSDAMSPSQYEVYCAEELKRYGWNAAVTKGSRDQGVDVVATKLGIRIVLQCKLYSQPVGNKAVQEVVAARNFVRARFGIVVSNNSYTTPAHTLAAANGVYLIHHRELAGLESLLRKSTF